MRADGDQRSSVEDQEQRRSARILAARRVLSRRRQGDAGRAHQGGENGEIVFGRAA